MGSHGVKFLSVDGELQVGSSGACLPGSPPGCYSFFSSAFSSATRRLIRPSSGTQSIWRLKPFPSAWAQAAPMRIQIAFLPSRSRTWYAAWVGTLPAAGEVVVVMGCLLWLSCSARTNAARWPATRAADSRNPKGKRSAAVKLNFGGTAPFAGEPKFCFTVLASGSSVPSSGLHEVRAVQRNSWAFLAATDLLQRKTRTQRRYRQLGTRKRPAGLASSSQPATPITRPDGPKLAKLRETDTGTPIKRYLQGVSVKCVVPKNNAPVRVTGGAGFNFEDKVAAFFLASLLARSHPCGRQSGTPSRIEWQVPHSEQGLDDLLITMEAAAPVRLAISIKSNRQVTQSGFPRSFVDAVRACCVSSSSSNCVPPDLIGLAVGQLAGSVREAWHALLSEVMLGDPNSILTRYTSASHSSQIGRDLFRSFVGEDQEPNTATVALVKRVRLFYFDFFENESRDEARALELCQSVVSSGRAEDARSLWNRLIGIAAERRAAGGVLDHADLVHALSGEHKLKDPVDQRKDWEALDRRSADVAKAVRDSVGERVSLVRREPMDQLRSRVWEGLPVVIAGEGGSGKSSFAKRVARSREFFDRFVWLNAAALEHDSLAEVERSLGLQNTLEALLTSGSGTRSCLVLDGFEGFSPRAFSRALSLLELLGPSSSRRGWTVAVTTRPQALENAHRLLVRAGLATAQAGTVYVKPLSDIEYTQVLGALPRLNGYLIRRELRSTLTNLKVLDWLASDTSNFKTSEVQSWTSTTAVIESLWASWVGSDGASAARAGVMKRLGQLDGNGLQTGVGTSELDPAELSVLAELESRGLLVVSCERVMFSHDTLGDWARLRILIEKTPLGESLANYARFPRWHDAIRLYSQHLLERDATAPTRWNAALSSLNSATTTFVVARDMFVEGLFSASGGPASIEKAWPVLLADNGMLLNRMLSRFQYAATIPDPRFKAISTTTDDKTELATLMRLPWWPLWPAFLSTLAAHAADVAKHCPIQAAQLCAMWLKFVPTGTIGRQEASTLALAIGREVQAARGEGHPYYHDQSDTVVFEAVLLATPEHPDEVATLCLELARRRPDPPNVVARSKAYQLRVEREHAKQLSANPRAAVGGTHTSLIRDRGVMRPQFPDGPAARVDDALQRAVFDTHGLVTLASVRPDAARELLLACSLEAPRHVRRDDSMSMFERFGTEDIPSMHQPMWFRGPWLLLLRQDPNLGVDCIMRLVDHATDQWMQQVRPPTPTEDHRARASVSLTVEGRERNWCGDMRVYGWHRERLCSANLLVSALMALERYLYECIDRHESIDDVVAQVFARGSSVATLAVLVSVVKYKPALLSGCLQPLLGVWILYDWDVVLLHDRDLWQIGFARWVSAGEIAFNAAREWHMMPHRKQTFRDQAVGLMLTNTQVRSAFVPIRMAWKAKLDAGHCSDHEGLERHLARFDPANYKLSRRDDTTFEAQLEWPEVLRCRTDEGIHKAEVAMTVIAFPYRCREQLENGFPLDDDQALQLWQQLQAFAASDVINDDSELKSRRTDALIGGIAVLHALAPAWLSARNEHAEWCAIQIANVVSDPPESHVFDSDHSIATDKWHSFFADIAITLLAENTSNHNARIFAAQCVLSNWYATTGIALTAAHRRRAELGDEFHRLVNLAVLWAALRTTLPHHDASEAETKRFKQRIARLQLAYTNGRVPSGMLDWSVIAGIASRSNDRAQRRRFPMYEGLTPPRRRGGGKSEACYSTNNTLLRYPPGFDTEALRHALCWLPNPNAVDATERTSLLAWLERLLGVTLGTIPETSDGGEEVDGTPYQYDNWVLDRVAVVVSQLDSDEEACRLWQPILDLGPPAHYWVERFLIAWTVVAPRQASSSGLYFVRWRQMIHYAMTSPTWKPPVGGSFRLAGLWEHLLAMGRSSSVVATEENQAEFASMKNEYGTWAVVFLARFHSLQSFLALLRQPGARPLLFPAIPWLRQAAEALHPYEWAQYPIADEIATILNLAWTWSSDAIAADQSHLADFTELLNMLVARQSRIAMALRDSVGRSAVVPP